MDRFPLFKCDFIFALSKIRQTLPNTHKKNRIHSFSTMTISISLFVFSCCHLCDLPSIFFGGQSPHNRCQRSKGGRFCPSDVATAAVREGDVIAEQRRHQFVFPPKRCDIARCSHVIHIYNIYIHIINIKYLIYMNIYIYIRIV